MKTKLNIVDTGTRINSPTIFTVVFFHPWQTAADRRKKPYPVLIHSGQYEVNNRISNFWYWRRVSKSGRILPDIEHGYGNFTLATGCSVNIKMKVIPNEN